MKDINIFCVLKSGKNYNSEHVDRLKAAVERNTSVPVQFTCLSDVPVKCDRIPLRHQWPGYWSKIELFRPGVADPNALNVYIDLDVLITGNLDKLLAYDHRFSMTRDDDYPDRANSSVMAWTGDHSDIYEEMKKSPFWNRLKFRRVPWYGDQALVEKMLMKKGISPERLDDIFNGCSRTFRHMVSNNDLDERTLFLSFQGPVVKPGHSALNDNPLILKYWNPPEIDVDEFDFGNFHFRAEAAKALNVTPLKLSHVGPAFVEEHKVVLKQVWDEIQSKREYVSTEADRAYRRTAHLQATAPLPTRNSLSRTASLNRSAQLHDTGGDDNTLLNTVTALAIVQSFDNNSPQVDSCSYSEPPSCDISSP